MSATAAPIITLTIPPRGCLRHTLEDLSDRTGAWTPAELHARDMSTPKVYQVLFQQHATGVYVRPTQPYHDALFENIFEFRCRCADYSSARTVSLEGVEVTLPSPAPSPAPSSSCERAPSSAPPSP